MLLAVPSNQWSISASLSENVTVLRAVASWKALKWMEYAIASPEENKTLGRAAFIASMSIWRRRVNVSRSTPVQSVEITQSPIKRVMIEAPEDVAALSLNHDIDEGFVMFSVMLFKGNGGCC